jgi:hypothetical protein
VNVTPAMVSVPVRAFAAEFCATAYCTPPFASPDAPLVMVIQPALLAAVQPQPEPAVTFTLLLPPDAVIDALDALSV